MDLPATATLTEAAALARALEAEVAGAAGASTLVVDAAALAQFDTSLLAVLLQARRLARGAGRAFEIRSPPPKLAQLAQLYGVAELLSLEGRAPAAVVRGSLAEPAGSSARRPPAA